MQMPNLELGFQIDFVIVFGPQTIARLRPVLTHHDDRRLHSSETGENQVEENEWIGIKGACHEDNAVEGDPKEEYRAKRNQKFPTAAELRNSIGKPLPESQFSFELFADISGKNLVLLQTLDHFVVERRKFANLIFQNLFDVILAKFAQIIEANERFAVQVGEFLLYEFQKRRPNQFRDHPAVRRLWFFANLADHWRRYIFTHGNSPL